MSIDIQNRLTSVEVELLTSFNEGPSSLDCFARSWSSLVDSLNTQTLDIDTAHLSHAVARRVETITSDLLEFHRSLNALREDLTTDLDSLLQQLTINDIVSPPFQHAPSTPPPLSMSCPPYIAPAYKWLLKNIHNPYPSKKTKSLICKATATSLQNIDAWFINARRRIGWTTLSKKFFSGSKTETIKAAYRALIKDDFVGEQGEKEMLSANIRMAFVQMEAAAKELYSERFTRSALAGKLDGLVKDMTDEDRQRRKAGIVREKGRTKRQRERDHLQSKMKEMDMLSPSPTTRPATLPSSIARKKRRLSEENGNDEFGMNVLSGRPNKRARVLSATGPRSSVSSSTEGLYSSRSSPESSVLSQSEDEPQILPSAYDESGILSDDKSLSSRPSVIQRATRKRRLSETGPEPTCKRQAPVRPRLQTVSEPFSKSTLSDALSTPASSISSTVSSPLFEVASIPEWSSFVFNTPETAVLDQLDLSMLHEPEFSCVAETAAMLNCGDRVLHEFNAKGFDPLTSPTSLLEMSAYSGSDHLFGSEQSDLSVSWPYDDITRLFSIQLPIATSTESCNIAPQSGQAYEPLATLDDLSSLSTLPMNQLAALTPSLGSSVRSELSTFDDLDHVNWLSIVPQPLSSETFASNTTFQSAVVEAPQMQTATQIVNESALPLVHSLPLVSTSLTITPEDRAQKYRQYRELLNKAKQLEAELGPT